MEIIDYALIKEALLSVGLSEGQVVYLQTDLSTIGQIKGVKNRDEFCKIYLDCIQDIVGEKGTIVVPTYTTQVARYDIDFILEETPTAFGIFSEYIRRHAESLRSLHPINSVCAIGFDKEYICKNNGTNSYGLHSPFDRMLNKKAKILTIGLESGYVVGIAHHLEAAYCLPYVYNKLLKWSPIVNGVKDKRQYFATVRYLDLNIEYDLTAWVKHMRSLGGVKSAQLGSGWVHMADYKQVFLEGARMLADNPYYFLKQKPEFIYGKIPFDGPTAGKDNIASDESRKIKGEMNWTGYYLMNKSYAGGDEEDLV